MSRRHLVATLPDEEREFIIQSYIAGNKTARSLSAAYEQQFNKPLPKSSVHRWLSAIGEDLIEKYSLQDQIINHVVADLKDKGLVDKHSIIIENIRNASLMGLHDAITANPIALIKIQQEEKKREQKDREIDLKERAQTFAEEQSKKAEQLEKDRFEIAAETWRFILAFVKSRAPKAVDQLTDISEELLTELENFIAQKG